MPHYMRSIYNMTTSIVNGHTEVPYTLNAAGKVQLGKVIQHYVCFSGGHGGSGMVQCSCDAVVVMC